MVRATSGRIRSRVTHLTTGTHTTNVRVVLTARHPSISIVANIVGTGVPAHVTLAASSRVSDHAVVSRTNTRGLLNHNSVLFGPINASGPDHIRNYFIDGSRVGTIISFIGNSHTITCSGRIVLRVRHRTTVRGGRHANLRRSNPSRSPLLSSTVGTIVRSKRTSASFLRHGLGLNCTHTTHVVSRVRRQNIINRCTNSGPHRILVACSRCLRVRTSSDSRTW